MNVEKKLKMNNKNIKIYTLGNCGYCKTVKAFLNTNNIEFEERSTVEYKNDWNEIGYLTGMSTTPTIVIEDKILIPGRDFRSPDHLLNIIMDNTVNNIDDSKLILERLKTLTYNIYSAFGRIDTILKQIETNTKQNEE